jgi:hypothetical protein
VRPLFQGNAATAPATVNESKDQRSHCALHGKAILKGENSTPFVSPETGPQFIHSDYRGGRVHVSFGSPGTSAVQVKTPGPPTR